jgi:hypothetical protein
MNLLVTPTQTPSVSLFDALSITLSPIDTDLREHGGQQKDGSCPACKHGRLFDYDNQTICSNCSLVVGDTPDAPTQSVSEWERFWSQRPTYYQSGIKRCVGGFPRNYDWVEADDIDGSVEELDPDVFYE